MMRLYFQGRLSRAAGKRLQNRLVEDRTFFEAVLPVLVTDLDRGIQEAARDAERPRLEVVR